MLIDNNINLNRYECPIGYRTSDTGYRAENIE